MRYKGGKLHTAKIKNRRYDINVSKNEADDGVYTTAVGNKTYKMKAVSLVAPSAVPLKSMIRAPSAAPSPVNILNQQLTPEQAAQKGINFMLKKQQQGFQRHNNDNATRSAAEKALQYSQARNAEQVDDDLRRNTYEEMARNKAQSNATMSSQLRNKKQANNQASRNQQNMALRAEAQSNANNSSKLWHDRVMKMEKEENSVLLPKKPSNMSPLQIAGQLERDLQQLEGPVYASVLVPKPELEAILGRKPPVFMLLGDIHRGVDKCKSCAQPGCYSLYKNKGYHNNRSTFLDYLDVQTKLENWIIDIFHETWAGKDERKSEFRSITRAMGLTSYDPNKREEYDKNNSKHTSALMDWQIIFAPCIGYIQNPYHNSFDPCEYKHFRIHDSDVRKHGTMADYNADNTLDLIMIDICKNIQNWDKQNIEKFIILLETKLSHFMPKVTLMEYINMIEFIYIRDSTIKDIIKHEYFQKSSRTVHELRQLPPELYDGLINNPELGLVFDNSSNSTIVKNVRPLIKFFISFLKELIGFRDRGADFIKEMNTEVMKTNMESFIMIIDAIIKIMNVNLNLSTRLVDLYTIARALKPFKKGYETSLYSQLAVCYFGGAHTRYTELLLNQWYTSSVSWGTHSNKIELQMIQDGKTNTKTIVKCIKQNNQEQVASEEANSVKILSKRNAVMSQLDKYSHKAKLNANAIAAFTPSNAYYIMGHGGQMKETFTVPEGCIIIVKVAEGESFYQTNKYLPLMCNMNLSVLTDPIKNRLELNRALGSVAIYHPGATCPNFQYNLVESVTRPEFSIISDYGSGVVNMEQFKEDKKLCALDHLYSDSSIERFKQVRENKNSDEIKSFIANSYKYSIYPTPEDVKIHIDLLNTDKTDISSVIEGLQVDPFFRPTQNDLCQKIKGVFFNFVCRPNNSLKPIMEYHTHEGLTTNKIKNNIKGLLTLQDNPSFSNPNSIRNYKTQKLKNAEANLEGVIKEYTSLPVGEKGSPANEAWTRAWYKKKAALEKIKNIKSNTTRRLLQSRLEESVGFRKPGIRNMVESTKYNNAKRIQEYMNELAKTSLEEKEIMNTIENEKHSLHIFKSGHQLFLNKHPDAINYSRSINDVSARILSLENKLKSKLKKKMFFERELAKMDGHPSKGGNRRFKRTRRIRRM